jgi:hypothetical protein
MAKFSDRLGITQPPRELQINSMNDDLRNSLWNWVFEVIAIDRGRKSVRTIWKEFLKRTVDTMPRLPSPVDVFKADFLRKEFLALEWYQVYDFVEFVYNNVLPRLKRAAMRDDPHPISQMSINADVGTLIVNWRVEAS